MVYFSLKYDKVNYRISDNYSLSYVEGDCL